MRSAAVVVSDPGPHGRRAVGRGLERLRIGPFAKASLNEALGLAVGARGVRPGGFVFDAVFGQQIAEGKAFVGRAVIAHDTFGGDAMVCEPFDRAGGEDDSTFLAFIRQQLGVGQAGGIIDGDVQELPTKTTPDGAPIALSGAIAGDPMTNSLDTAELLDIDMDQFARLFALVADDRRLRIER